MGHALHVDHRTYAGLPPTAILCRSSGTAPGEIVHRSFVCDESPGAAARCCQCSGSLRHVSPIVSKSQRDSASDFRDVPAEAPLLGASGSPFKLLRYPPTLLSLLPPCIFHRAGPVTVPRHALRIPVHGLPLRKVRPRAPLPPTHHFGQQSFHVPRLPALILVEVFECGASDVLAL